MTELEILEQSLPEKSEHIFDGNVCNQVHLDLDGHYLPTCWSCIRCNKFIKYNQLDSECVPDENT